MSRKLIIFFLVIVLLSLFVFYTKGKHAIEQEESFDYASASIPSKMLLGSYVSKYGDYSNASKIFDSLLKENKTPFVAENSIKYDLLSGDFNKALKVAKNFKINSAFLSSDFLIAVDEFKNKQYDKAMLTVASASDIPNTSIYKGIIIPVFKEWCRISAGHQDMKFIPKIAEDFQNSSVIDIQRAFIFDYLNKKEEALSIYGRIVNESPTVTNVLIYAESLIDNNQKDKAIEIIEEIKSRNKYSTGLDGILSYVKKKEKVDGHKIQINEYLSIFFIDLGVMINSLGFYEQSLIFLNISNFLSPSSDHVNYIIGKFYETNAEYEEAINYYRKITSKSPYTNLAKIGLYTSMAYLGEDEAISSLEKISSKVEEKNEAYSSLADIYRENKEYNKLIGIYNNLILSLNKFTKQDYILFLQRGEAYDLNNDFELAEKDYKKALELNSSNPYVKNNLAYLWLSNGINIEEAYKLAESAYSDLNADPAIMDTYALALLKIGKSDEAKLLCEQAIELLPSDPSVNEHMGDIFFQEKYNEKAIHFWNNALENYTAKKDIDRINRKLEKIDKNQS